MYNLFIPKILVIAGSCTREVNTRS